MGLAQPNPAQEDDVGTHRQEFLKDLPAVSAAIKHDIQACRIDAVDAVLFPDGIDNVR